MKIAVSRIDWDVISSTMGLSIQYVISFCISINILFRGLTQQRNQRNLVLNTDETIIVHEFEKNVVKNGL